MFRRHRARMKLLAYILLTLFGFSVAADAASRAQAEVIGTSSTKVSAYTFTHSPLIGDVECENQEVDGADEGHPTVRDVPASVVGCIDVSLYQYDRAGLIERSRLFITHCALRI